ncbi:branched-chain amino acid ABC transporter permease [Burkholderia cenocepacia]|uniref:ABC transporter permease n=1 Tax=Burkholderia pseudomultivorans TaxID=1207504 RepID=A0A132EQ26_9BURK|nr:branched-chain amino acid ABC transporter permease [Burkholderia pseudomultivorans]KVG62321.1 ABC transporter permease [Burkholderia pseudomultivorans]KWF12510.1 ABC transporter permease [Burkholderia pseudomultivorans]KWF55890.1 ABC transporter permease [Burkholderia pseudomultivorans]
MLQFLVDVLIRTSDIMLVAVGLSVVYSLVRFPNVAHVQYAMLGAFATLGLTRAGLPFALALAGSCAGVGLLAVALNTLVFRRLLRSGSSIAMIGSLAISMILIAFVLGVAGSRPWRYASMLSNPLQVGSTVISIDQLTSIVCGFGCIVLLAALLFRTNIGRSMRAMSSNPALAAATGVDGARVLNGITFLSGVLAALGGTMLGLTETVHVGLGSNLLLPVFAAAILGGLGNPLGAAAGALLISIAETLVTNVDFGWVVGGADVYVPVTYVGAASFVILLVALLFKPYGIFDREVRRV